MRVCYVLLAAMTTLLASNEVAAIPSHAVASTDQIDAAQMAVGGHRLLRTHEAADVDKLQEEERAPLPASLLQVSLKDLMKVDDLVDPKKLKIALGKTEEASKTRTAMFDEMFSNKGIRREVLAHLDKLDDFMPLKSAWTKYAWRKAVEYERNQEKAAIAAARRGAQ
ncbi:hypothetical protein PR003_g21716 [Phytophthora rubi]|uniref:RxLR effector protein n=1 Tax=Phytophthora rubi TaxID=129364 RepID=A0A6A3HF54_9STRA|nr:hypothetical protein PR002_g28076 [Phytophthora rubi]KAE8994183.1 hypothetical protein PR001_g20470 [Phytophthora rubi]KAE9304599.1 hypothetical protein PR003_g21716 [Phytophthora rubi]